MKVLLTGDKGYIGTVMKSFLRKYGHDVTGLDSNYFQFCTFGDVDLYEIGEYHIPKDIRDVSVSDLKGYDAVIHLASLSNDLMGDFNHDLTMEINLYATLTLASKAKRAGVKKFIFASSCSVYGANDHVVDEDAPMRVVRRRQKRELVLWQMRTSPPPSCETLQYLDSLPDTETT
jgi:nucleoside-diphosphate-sugar epimerase